MKYMRLSTLEVVTITLTSSSLFFPFSTLTAALATCVSEEVREKEGEEEGRGKRER